MHRPLFFCCTQKSRADCRIEEVSNKRTETNIREKMIGHVDAIVAVDQYKDTGHNKAAEIFPRGPFLRYVCKHRQREHHGGVTVQQVAFFQMI